MRLVAGTLARPVLDQRPGGAGRRTRRASRTPRATPQTRDELIRRADLALRAAKRKQRGGLTRFEPAMDVEFDDRRFLERELKRALDEKALDVHYQPIVTRRRHPHRRRRGAAALDPSGARRRSRPRSSCRSPSIAG